MYNNNYNLVYLGGVGTRSSNCPAKKSFTEINCQYYKYSVSFCKCSYSILYSAMFTSCDSNSCCAMLQSSSCV